MKSAVSCVLLLLIFHVCVVWSPEDIHSHLMRCEVEYLQFAFRWMNNLLMRELPLRCTIRLWDTYQVGRHAADLRVFPGADVLEAALFLLVCVLQAEAEGFSHFHLYVCAAFLLEWRKQILSMSDFQVPSGASGVVEASVVSGQCEDVSLLLPRAF